MGCGSCGQKYRGLSRMRGSPNRVRPNTNARAIQSALKATTDTLKESTVPPKEIIDVPQPPVTVQPDTKEGVAVPVPDYPLDPMSGLPIELIKTGSCPENMLGDTAPQPVNPEIADVPGSKNDVG